MDLIDALAEICHEVNRAYCRSAMNDTSHEEWSKAPDWQKDSCRAGVKALLGSNLNQEQMHSIWMAEKAAKGWTYGEVKDDQAKTHPCMVPYAELPQEQKVKDFLFRAVVKTIERQNT